MTSPTVPDAPSRGLVARRILVERYSPESGPGQHEISVRRDGLSLAEQVRMLLERY